MGLGFDTHGVGRGAWALFVGLGFSGHFVGACFIATRGGVAVASAYLDLEVMTYGMGCKNNLRFVSFCSAVVCKMKHSICEEIWNFITSNSFRFDCGSDFFDGSLGHRSDLLSLVRMCYVVRSILKNHCLPVFVHRALEMMEVTKLAARK